MRKWRRRARRFVGRVLPPQTGAAILGYHRIAERSAAPGGDPFSMCVSPESFRTQMRCLREIGRPVSLGHLLRAADAGISVRGMIAVTFDDGYEDVLTLALPELERWEIPATVFFVAENAGRPFWWDRLTSLLADGPTRIPFRVHMDSTEFVWSGLGSLDELRVRLHRALRILDGSERDGVLDRLQAAWRSTVSDLPRALTHDEARTLLRSPFIEPGAHSLSHPPLAEIAPRRAEHEIGRARSVLREALDRQVDAFSYPHGSRSALTDRFVKDAGYGSACASRQDSVRPGTDRFALPRVWVTDQGGRSFRRRVARYVGTSTRPTIET